jgi:beta-glucosidase
MGKYTALVDQLTIEEKVALLSGTNFWETNAIPRLGIPSIYMTDGPCGLRKQGEETDHLGFNSSQKTTCFPNGVTIASAWNRELASNIGKAIARECNFYHVDMLLAPGINIKRNPLCGRAFEYYSEDPIVSGHLGASYVKGVQSQGVGASLKHLALNNNENFRFNGNSIADERTSRELYLKAFEYVVKNAQPHTVMAAYNQIDGIYCSENEQLLQKILREEWGFDGAVVSDWGGVSDRVRGLKAGLDLEMPGDCDHFRAELLRAYAEGELDDATLNRGVTNVLRLIEQVTGEKPQETEACLFENQQLAIEAATEGAVLLKNNGSLPLKRESIPLVIGEFFTKMRYQGAGSSMVTPTEIITPQKAFEQRELTYEYVRGYAEIETEPNEKLMHEALEIAEKYEEVLFFGGQTDYTESEGYDREHLQLPANQRALIEQLLAAGKKIIFILYTGSPVELPFEPQLAAILNMYLPGQAGGEATAQLLLGEKSPSGKLAETWVETYPAIPFAAEFSQQRTEYYRESLYVGYRYFDTVANQGVRYPFGYGLSYTEFVYRDLVLTKKTDKLILSCVVQNVGNMASSEILQLYVQKPKSDVFKPLKELVSFGKVFLLRGEEKTVHLEVDVQDLAYYHVGIKDWVIENGTYIFQVGASVADIRLSTAYEICEQPTIASPYKIEKLPHYYNPAQLKQATQAEFIELLSYQPSEIQSSEKYSFDSQLSEITNSIFGKILYRIVMNEGLNQIRGAKKNQNITESEMQRKSGLFLVNMIPHNSIRSIMTVSRGRLSYPLAQGLIDLMNKHYWRGLKNLLRKEKVPPLPKNQ